MQIEVFIISFIPRSRYLLTFSFSLEWIFKCGTPLNSTHKSNVSVQWSNSLFYAVDFRVSAVDFKRTDKNYFSINYSIQSKLFIMAFVEPYSNYIISYIYLYSRNIYNTKYSFFYQCWKDYLNLHVPYKLMNILGIGFLEKSFCFQVFTIFVLRKDKWNGFNLSWHAIFCSSIKVW